MVLAKLGSNLSVSLETLMVFVKSHWREREREMYAVTTYDNCKPMGEFDPLASFMHEQLMPETDG